MKRTDRPQPAQNPQYALYRTPGTGRAETVVFGTLGLAGLAAVCLALSWGTTLTEPQPSPIAGYFRSGHVEADLRTANALVQYLMEIEPPKPTNLVERVSSQPGLPSPTNTVSTKPNA